MKRSYLLAALLVIVMYGGAAATETAAYIYGLVGVFAGKYESDASVYEKLVGYYDYGHPAPAPNWQEVALSSTDFAASPFGFGLKADSWRASFVGLWSRHKIDSMTQTRQVNNASLTATGGYILNRGYFADKAVRPYFGGFWRGGWTKAENVHNGVIASGFGPDLGALVEFELNDSFALVTFGYQYKIYSVTGTTFDTAVGDDPPAAPHWNYTYVPADEVPSSGAGLYLSAKSSLQFHRRVGVEVELRYDLDLNDTFVNGLTFAAGPSLWL